QRDRKFHFVILRASAMDLPESVRAVVLDGYHGTVTPSRSPGSRLFKSCNRKVAKRFASTRRNTDWNHAQKIFRRMVRYFLGFARTALIKSCVSISNWFELLKSAGS